MTVRAFIGIPLPITTRRLLSAACDAMREASPDWSGEKWVPQDNLHVTLKFLGDLPEGLLEEAGRVLTDTAGGVRAFPVSLADIAPIPRLRTTTMLWAMPGDGAGSITSLAETIDAALAAAGFPAETRGFRPHVTLVRARRPRRTDLALLDAGQRILFHAEDRSRRMSVREVTLYTSTLTPHGPVYREHLTAPLAE